MSGLSLELMRPGDEGDLRTILKEAGYWMKSDLLEDHPLAEDFTDKFVKRQVASRQVYFVRLGDERVGCVKIAGSDLEVWPDKDDNKALYVHMLAIRSGFKGRGFGQEVLAIVADRAAQQGRSLVRLDCLSTSAGLRKYYEGLGFRHRGDMAQSNGSVNWQLRRYERTVA